VARIDQYAQLRRMVKSEERDAAPVSAPTIGRHDIFKSEGGNTVNENALQAYGERSDIKELGDRVKRFLPNGDKMSAEDALGLAQIAIAQDLNPFAREIWFVPGLGIVTGIEGYRKLARRVAHYTAQTREMTPEERAKHRLEEGEFGAVCELYRPDVIRDAVAVNNAAGAEVIPVLPTIGIGIKRPTERNSYAPTGRSLMWVAEKRAEADALRKAFDIQVGFADAHVQQDPVTVIEEDALPTWATEELAKDIGDNHKGESAEWDGGAFDAGEEALDEPTAADPPPQKEVTQAMHDRWDDLWQEAKGLDLALPGIAWDIGYDALVEKAGALKEAIAQRKADIKAAQE